MHESIWVTLALGFGVSAIAERLLPSGPEMPNKIIEDFVAMGGAYAATVGGRLLRIYGDNFDASLAGAVIGAGVAVAIYRLFLIFWLWPRPEDAPESAPSTDAVPKKPARDTAPRP